MQMETDAETKRPDGREVRAEMRVGDRAKVQTQAEQEVVGREKACTGHLHQGKEPEGKPGGVLEHVAGSVWKLMILILSHLPARR